MVNPKHLALILVFFYASQASAQLELVPAGHVSPVLKGYATENTCNRVLTLPVFDDFSVDIGTANPSIWRSNKGVYLNNTFTENHPSAGIATFDGLDEYAQPYFEEGGSKVVPADSLVSQCIDLAGLSPSDSITISFYYNGQGFGEQPNLEDSLVLIAQDLDGNWKRIWSAVGDTVIAGYRLASLKLTDPSFYHGQFQIAFFNYAKSTGYFDHWHLDYVHIFRKDDDDPKERFDVALVEQPSSFLGEYSAMPYTHFQDSPSLFAADSLFTQIFNLSETFVVSTFSAKLSQYEFIDGQPYLFDEQELATYSENGAFGADRALAGSTLGISAVNDKSFVDMRFDSTMIETQFYLDNEEQNDLLPTRNNDTLSFRTYLTDYAAYDDGSAEYGLGIRQKFGMIAYQYHTPFRAPLTDIDIHIPPFGTQESGGIYRLMIWQSIAKTDGQTDEILLRQTRPVIYADSVNKFERINIISETAPTTDWLYVEDTFYIGIQQISDEMLAIGFDKNFDSGDKIYYNQGLKWEKNPGFVGSLMIRPVFRKLPPPTGLESEQELNIQVFPNPAEEMFQIQGQPFRHVQVTSLDGRVFYEKEGLFEDLKINTADWTPGFYLVRISDGNATAQRKLIVK